MVDTEARQRAEEIAEKYAEVLRPMSDKALVDELERQALMATFGYQSPGTVTMLKTAKGEILRRLKGGSGPASKPDGAPEDPAPEQPVRQSLFD